MRPENAEHCDGSGCMLSWMLQLFCCLHLHGITKYVVVKVEVGTKDLKRVFFKDQFLLWFLCLVLGCFCSFFLFFNEESCIFK